MSGSATQEVFEKVLARPVVTEGGEHPAAVHLWWSAPGQGDRVVQIYIDGELVDVTVSPPQREAWVLCDRGRAHRIELLAVGVDEPECLWVERLELLNSWEPAVVGELGFSVIRDERLAVESVVSVLDGGVMIDEGALWPADAHRGGMGAVFGVGEFGYDAVTGVGLGRGELGMGRLGADGEAWRWFRNDLAVGQHSLEVVVEDRTGQIISGPAPVGEFLIEALPVAASKFEIVSDFTLGWSV